MRPPHWMVWNMFLALVPLGLSVWLFRVPWRHRGGLWVTGVIAFVLFLPNAPYVVTDGIHLVQWLQLGQSWMRSFNLVAGFSVFFFLGLEAYALCIVNLRHFVGRTVVPLELAVHGLCAIGIYLGRVARFNSWDIVGNGHAILHAAHKALTQPWPVILVTVAFVVTAVGCEIVLAVNRLAWHAAEHRLGH